MVVDGIVLECKSDAMVLRSKEGGGVINSVSRSLFKFIVKKVFLFFNFWRLI